MGWLYGRFRLRSRPKMQRRKKEEYQVYLHKKAVSGWKVLDAQLLLEHWLGGNGIR